MKRKVILAVTLLVAAAVLSACSAQPQQQTFPMATQYIGPAVTAAPTQAPQADSGAATGGAENQSIFEQNPYDVMPADEDYTETDAMNEEDQNYADAGAYEAQADNGLVDGGQNDFTYDGDTTVFPYAGSTPIPLDPIDMPSPTPRPELVFAYVPYEVASLGVKFEAPAGWVPDESVNQTYTLSEPEQQMKDGQLGVLQVFAVPVTKQYSESDLKSEVNQRLNTLSATNFVQWKPSLTASRYLMGGKGIYANYSGTLANGVEVGGRIHVTCIDKVLYCLQITYPYGYKDDYLGVFSQARSTLKLLQ